MFPVMCSPLNLASYRHATATSGMALCLSTRLAALNEVPVDWQARGLQLDPVFVLLFTHVFKDSSSWTRDSGWRGDGLSQGSGDKLGEVSKRGCRGKREQQG